MGDGGPPGVGCFRSTGADAATNGCRAIRAREAASLSEVQESELGPPESVCEDQQETNRR
jgi:hypothetical protein